MNQKLQERLNNVIYPQNYYYDIDTLKPLNNFKLRFDFLKRNAEELFYSYKSFLDIGSSLGYFLFYQSKLSENVLGIEPDKEAYEISLEVKKYRNAYNVEILNSTFSSYTKNDTFDLIFIGNCFHYLYKDEGWNIVKRLSNISSHYIVLELPLEGKHLIEIGGWKDDEMSRDYTKRRFINEVEKYFTILRIMPSGTVGDRKIIVLSKEKS